MRTIPAAMQTLWSNGGPLIGDAGAPSGYVTVEPGWGLTTTTATVGTYTRGPVRWWQRADNSQVEVIVPNVQTIDTNRSLDQDGATATIVLGNQWHYLNGQITLDPTMLGQPGFFTPFRGNSAESLARWGQTVNDWNGVFVPNALLRTYQGYGGKTKDLGTALNDGNVILTGVWMVDQLTLGTDGRIQLQCRDMAKLLIDQQLFPPLIPQNLYPLVYARWAFREYKGNRLAPMVPSTFLGEATTPLVVGAVTDIGGAYPDTDHSDDFRDEPGNGYWLLVNNGNVYNFGNNPAYGSAAADWVNNEAEDIDVTRTGKGYVVLRRDGVVQAFGDAVNHGQVLSDPSITTPPAVWHNGSTNSIAITSTGAGYWISRYDGVVYAFGDAINSGNHADINLVYPAWETSTVCVDIAADPLTTGYWTLDSYGGVEAHGAASAYGQPRPVNDQDGNPINVFVRITPHPLGGGYWVLDQNGAVFAYGTAHFHGELPGSDFPQTEGLAVNWPLLSFPDFATDLVADPAGNGYWIVGVSGGVFPFGQQKDGTPLEYLGSLSNDYDVFLREDGNYLDYADIINELLLWSGFYLFTPSDSGFNGHAFGNIESTGGFAEDPLPHDLVDKKPVIDVINSVKEVVGYIFLIDETGAPKFQLPNIWNPGNFFEDGTHTTFIPDIDEALQLTQYSLQHTDTSLRSEIIISTNDPTYTFQDTITTRLVPSNASLLRGMVKPAMWINGLFTRLADQETMAELIALYSFLAQRQGSLTALCNPMIQLDDQVRIWERITSETYIHYVRGIATHMDLNSGDYTMQLTTHWMGDGTNVLPPPGTGGGGTGGGGGGGGGASVDLIPVVLSDGPEGYWVLDETTI